LFTREFYVEQDYKAGYVETLPDTDIQEVQNYSAMRDALENLIYDGADSGTIRTKNYSGVVADDISRAVNSAVREMPLGVFTVDYISQDTHFYLTYYEIELHIYYSRNKDKIPKIQNMESIAKLLYTLDDVLENFDTEFTFEIASTRITERMLRNYITNRCEQHPETMVEIPEVTIVAYPNMDATHKIVTMKFGYSGTRDHLLALRMLRKWEND